MMSQRSIGFITVAAVLAGLLIGFALWRTPAAGQGLLFGRTPLALQSNSNTIDSSPARTISVSGVGEVRAKPDTAFVSVGVQTQADSAASAQQQNAERMTAVVDAIKNLGVAESDIQTSGISLQPIYDSEFRPNGAEGRIVGYRAFNQVTVRVTDITKVGSVLDSAVNGGANVAGNIRFTIANDMQLRQQALKQAVQDARTKADAIASALGVNISGVHSAGEGSVSMPVAILDSSRAMAAPAATPIEPGELTVTAQVQVAYSY